MTIKESCKRILDDLEQSSFFSEINIGKLIRELDGLGYFPDELLGIELSSVNKACNEIFDDILEKYQSQEGVTIEDHFIKCIGDTYKSGYQETAKVVLQLYNINFEKED